MGEQISRLGVAVAEAVEAPSQSIESAENSVPVKAETNVTDDPDTESAGAVTVEKLSSSTFEENVAEVEAYFGGRIFTFQSHTGTAAQVAKMCPMMRMVFMRSAETAISFLEKFDETEKTELGAEDDLDQQPDDADGVLQDAQYVAEQATKKIVEANAEVVMTKTHVAQVAISAVRHEPMQERSVVEVAAEVSHVKGRQVVDVTRPGPEKTTSDLESELVAVRAIEMEAPPLPLPVPKNESKPKKEDHVHPHKKMERQEITPEIQEVIIVEAELSVAQKTVDDIPRVVVEKAIVVPETETVVEFTEPVEIHADLPEQEPIALPEIVHENKPEAKAEDVYDESIFAAEVETVDEAIVAESDVSQEPEEATDLFEAIADQLGIEHDRPSLPAETIENQSESETITLTPLLEIIEQIVDQPEEKQPLIKERLVEVVRSIEILKWARSAEECREAVDGLKTNLTLLLEELGCEEPELLTTQLLERYGLQSIDEIMNTALKVVRSKRSHSPRFTSVRHVLIGRHVMKLLFGELLHYPVSALGH